jgi:hypothetical protein
MIEYPVDMNESFHRLTRVLGAALQERADIRLNVLSAIRALIRYSLQVK